MESMEEDSQLEMDTDVQQESDREANSKIINSLNMDCWHLVLDYLTVKEVLQTELICKDWQTLIVNYFASRRIYIYDTHLRDLDEDNLVLRDSTAAWLSFKRWVRKFGHSVISFSLEYSFRNVVEILRDYCPNLDNIRLFRIKNKLAPTNIHHFQKLTSLHLSFCDELTDDCINSFLTPNIDYLLIRFNKRITGRFLNNLKTDKLEHLELYHCRALKFSLLFSIADRLNNLSKIVLWKRNRSKVEIRDKLHLLLDKMPNVEVVDFKVNDLWTMYNLENSLKESDVFFEAACRLKKLFAIHANFDVWDHHLEAIATNCKKVRVIDLICYYVTSSGYAALCRAAGPRIIEFGLRESRITDDQVAAFVSACPQLTKLDISNWHRTIGTMLSPVARIAEARRDIRTRIADSWAKSLRLTLIINHWDFDGDEDEFKDVIMLRNPNVEYYDVEDY